MDAVVIVDPVQYQRRRDERDDVFMPLRSLPRPPESFPYGSPDLRRLRTGRYRVFYTIDEERRVVQIDHVARLP